MDITWCFHGLYKLYSFLWHFQVSAVPAKFFSYAFPEEIFWYWKDGVKREWNEIYSLLSLLCSLTLHILLKIDTDTWSKCGKVILVFWVHSGYRMITCIRFFFFFFLNLFIYLFIYLWLCRVFVSMRGLSLVAASGGHSSSRCAGLSLSRPLLLRSTGSRRAGSVIVAHGPSCSAACGIFTDQGANLCPLHWQADSQPLHHQGSPCIRFWL